MKKQNRAYFLVPAVLVFAACIPAQAGTIPVDLDLSPASIGSCLTDPAGAGGTCYKYTGELYSTVQAPFTTAQRITLTVNFSAPLTPNQTYDPPAVVSVSDGVHTYSGSNVTAIGFISTDGQAMISQFDLTITSDTENIQIYTGTSEVEPLAGGGYPAIATGGSWEPCPEPSPVMPLALVALIGMGTKAGRRFRPERSNPA